MAEKCSSSLDLLVQNIEQSTWKVNLVTQGGFLDHVIKPVACACKGVHTIAMEGYAKLLYLFICSI